MARRRQLNVFGLTFLDAMTCGLGAVILLYLIINANVEIEKKEMTRDLQAETDLLERQVLEGQENLVEKRNTFNKLKAEKTISQSLAERLTETIKATEVDLKRTLDEKRSKQKQLEEMQALLLQMEAQNKLLAAKTGPPEKVTSDDIRAHIGDGDRQYLTGLKVGGKRIFIMIDSSASMLDETIVNILRLRNMSNADKRHAPKWKRTVATVDWLTTQLPNDAYFQIYTFSETAEPLLAGTDHTWLNAGDPDLLDKSMKALRDKVPAGGTSFHKAFSAVSAMRPRPDNMIFLVDGLPTWGDERPRSTTINSRKRVKLFSSAIDRLPKGMPVNTILFPMEGDPLAAAAFWKLALVTRGSLMSPSEDWP